MFKKCTITIIILLTFIQSIYCQERWSLNECVHYALENNLKLNDLKLNSRSSKENSRQSFRDLLPSVRGVSEYNVRYGRSVNPNDNGFINTDFFSNSYLLEGSVDIFSGFQKLNAIKASQFIFRASQEELQQQRYLMAFRVMQAFYDIKFFEGSLEIAKEQLAISQTNYDLLKKQIELGIKSGADLYETESLWLADKLNVKQSANQLKAAKLSLIQEMNLEGKTDIILEDVGSQNSDVSLNSEEDATSIYQKSQAFLPLIKASKLKVAASKELLQVEQGKLYPTINLFGGLGTGYYETIKDISNAENPNKPVPFSRQFRDNQFKVIGVSLNIPISRTWLGRSNIQQQKIESLKAENELLIQKQELLKTIQNLVQESKALQIEFEQSKKSVASQRLSFEVAQKRFNNGLISAVELYTVKNLFASAQNENLRLRLQAEVNNYTLKFYRGISVFNIVRN